MRLTVLVIDEFFADPDKVRQAAISGKWHESKRSGEESDVYRFLAMGDDYQSKELDESIRRIIGNYHYLYGGGRFRLPSIHHDDTFHVHSDYPADFNLIIYLSLPEDCKGGTSLFREKETGAEGIFSPSFRDLPLAARRDRSLWEETLHVPMVYNRAVFISGSYYHSQTLTFGNGDPVHGRLTYTAFLKRA